MDINGEKLGKDLSFQELPEMMTPKDLWNFLPIGRNAIYTLLDSNKIRNVRIGQKYIITKAALRDFLGGAVE